MSETLNDETVAGEPGRVKVSKKRLKALDPDLFKPGGDEEDRRWWKTHIKEHLWDGDSRAAVVLSTNPLRVAALTRELDCVAVLKFPSKLTREEGLEVGDHLLTVNTYAGADEFEQGHERDLTPGPDARGRWGNFSPMIAEFLSDDRERIEARKAEIDDDEFDYCQELGEAWLDAKRTPRNGRPSLAHVPAPKKKRRKAGAKAKEKGNGLLYFVIIVLLLGGLRIARKAFKAAKHAPTSALDDAAEGARKATRRGVDAGATADEVDTLSKARDVADAADSLRGAGEGKKTGRRTPKNKAGAEGAEYLARTLLQDKDPQVRATTAQLLGEAKPTRTVVRALARALTQDREARVRKQAARALGRLGKAARGAEPELRKALNDRAREVRAQAKWALTRIR